MTNDAMTNSRKPIRLRSLFHWSVVIVHWSFLLSAAQSAPDFSAIYRDRKSVV